MQTATHPNSRNWLPWLAFLMLAFFMLGLNGQKTASTANFFLAADFSAAHTRDALPPLGNPGIDYKGTADAPVAAKGGVGVAEGVGSKLPNGSFSIIDWSGYPSGLPKPTGPFSLLEGAEYSAARAQANAANRALHQADPALKGLQLHEIQPVKFGGSPTDPLNKTPLTPQQHAPVTNWWNQLQRDLQGKTP